MIRCVFFVLIFGNKTTGIVFNKYLQPDKSIVFLGSSGVGKSTFTNFLLGQEIMETRGIREEDSKGHHTTTYRQLFVLENGTKVIDTPSMRELGMRTVDDGMEQSFSDLYDLIQNCRFSDCTHTSEPGCAVQVQATKEQLYDILKELYNKVDGVQAENELENIYQFACQCYEGQKRYSGDEYITHPINVAIILAQMEADENTILAGLLCDILKKTEISVDTLKANIPIEVVSIVAGLNNFDVNQENIADNEGVTMVKLAERLHNMRTVEFMDDKKKVIKAKETLDLFMPIARKIGNEKLIEELNDLALKYA